MTTKRACGWLLKFAAAAAATMWSGEKSRNEPNSASWHWFYFFELRRHYKEGRRENAQIWTKMPLILSYQGKPQSQPRFEWIHHSLWCICNDIIVGFAPYNKDWIKEKMYILMRMLVYDNSVPWTELFMQYITEDEWKEYMHIIIA